jgi:translation initiation factor 3 subunit D
MSPIFRFRRATSWVASPTGQDRASSSNAAVRYSFANSSFSTLNRSAERHNQPQPVNTAFNYYHVNDDESFTTVDGKPTRTKNYYTRGRFNPRGRGYAGRGGQQGRGGGQGGWQQRGGAGGGGQSGQMTMQNRKKYDRGGRGGRGQGGWSQMNRRAQETLAARLPSVEVRPDWQHVQDLEMPSLQRLIIAEPEAEDM